MHFTQRVVINKMYLSAANAFYSIHACLTLYNFVISKSSQFIEPRDLVSWTTTDFDYGGCFGLPEKQMIGNKTNADIPIPQCLNYLFIMDIHIEYGHRISLH